jgi:hypothetical protein
LPLRTIIQNVYGAHVAALTCIPLKYLEEAKDYEECYKSIVKRMRELLDAQQVDANRIVDFKLPDTVANAIVALLGHMELSSSAYHHRDAIRRDANPREGGHSQTVPAELKPFSELRHLSCGTPIDATNDDPPTLTRPGRPVGPSRLVSMFNLGAIYHRKKACEEVHSFFAGSKETLDNQEKQQECSLDVLKGIGFTVQVYQALVSGKLGNLGGSWAAAVDTDGNFEPTQCVTPTETCPWTKQPYEQVADAAVFGFPGGNYPAAPAAWAAPAHAGREAPIDATWTAVRRQQLSRHVLKSYVMHLVKLVADMKNMNPVVRAILEEK